MILKLKEKFKEVNRLSSFIEKIEVSLNNPNFFNRAPAHVIELEKKKLSDNKILFEKEKEIFEISFSKAKKSLEDLFPLKWHLEYFREIKLAKEGKDIFDFLDVIYDDKEPTVEEIVEIYEMIYNKTKEPPKDV